MAIPKRKLQVFGFLFLSIVLILLIWYRTDKAENDDSGQPEFSIDNPEAVTRIFMVDKTGQHVDLKRTFEKSWKFNDSFEAWTSRVDFLLNETIAKLKLRSPVPNAARNNVMSRMAITSVKVEIYTDDEDVPFKVYYVGGTTPDLLGTYFLMNGDEDPYVIHIPGHNGYLSSRYTLDADEWYSRTVFGSIKREMVEAEVTYPSQPNESFKIVQKENEVEVEMEAGLPTNLNRGAVRSYLNLFEKLNFEGYDNTKSQSYIDSIKSTQPLVVIRVKSTNRGLDELTFFAKPVGKRTKELIDKDGNVLTTEADRYYAIYNKLDRLLVVQDYTFQKVLIRYSDLLLRNP